MREAISDYFEDDAEMMTRIAYCESKLRQFNERGRVVRNPVSPDYGVFQIHKPTWGHEADKLGLDIYTVEGNIEMADYILKTQGIAAWRASAACHGYWQN